MRRLPVQLNQHVVSFLWRYPTSNPKLPCIINLLYLYQFFRHSQTQGLIVQPYVDKPRALTVALGLRVRRCSGTSTGFRNGHRVS